MSKNNIVPPPKKKNNNNKNNNNYDNNNETRQIETNGENPRVYSLSPRVNLFYPFIIAHANY